MKILIVDDEQKNLLLLNDFMTELGHDVMSAENGKIALEMAIDNPPEIIISDILMPVMDGFKLCYECKKDAKLKNIPFVFYTATYTSEEDKKFAISLGADCFVVKPTSMKNLISIVNEVVKCYKDGKYAQMKHPKIGDETVILKEHFARMSRKLEQKLIQLEQSRQVLQESEEKFRAFTYNAMDAIILMDSKGCISYWNPAAEKIFGYREKDALGKQLYLLLAPKRYYEAYKRVFKEFKERGQRTSIGKSLELQAIKKGGIEFPIELSLSGIHIKGKWNTLWIVRDITDRKQAEDALEKERNLLRTLIDNLPDFIYIKDTESRFVTANNAVTNLMGVAKPDELIGKKDFDFYPKELAGNFYNDEQEIIRSGQAIIQREEPVIDSAGNNRWLSTTKVPLRDNRGKIVGIVGMGRDITDHKQMDMELRKLSLAVEQSPVSIVITDTEGNIEYINPKFTEITGYTYKEIIGKNPRILKSGEHPLEFYKELWDTITSGNEWRGELYNKKKNGELYWEHASISPIKDEEGVIAHFLGVKEDITERKRLEKQLVQSQKMEAIGTLAGGVAHDFNNLLSVIIGYSDFLLTKLDEEDHIAKHIEEIRKAGRRAATLTHQLLAFSRRQALQPILLDLNSVVTEMEKMLQRLIGEDIELITDFEPELRQVKADHGQVEQIIMNLAVNARDAMSYGGKLTIKTENVTIDENYCKIYPYTRPGNFVCLSITDTGIGMDKETISHIFEPFFTTKEVGTGLGLSVIYGIVKQHDGWINVYSEPGQGSSFKVYLQALSVEEKKEAEEKISVQELQGRGERILLVEDDQMLLEFTAGALRENGYKVFTAKTVKEALDLFAREKGDFCLVFSDVVLPDKTGIELIDHLLWKKPELKVLLTSGYLDRKSQWTKIQERGYNFVQKPFTLTDLLQSLKKVITQR